MGGMARALVSVGVDWFTLTSPEKWDGTAEDTRLLRDTYREHVLGGQAGMAVEARSWLGYSGHQFGSLFTGTRTLGSVVRVSGAPADVMARVYGWRGWKCTRLDLQITVKGNREPDAVVREAVGLALNAERTTAGRPPGVRHIMSFGGGDTLTVGARTSSVYGRCYNKEAESGREAQYLGCVRYELELKNSVAERVWLRLMGETEWEATIAAIVRTKWREWGVDLGEVELDVETGLLRHQPEETTLDSRLEWLTRTVRPVVEKIAAQGYRADALRALGLKDDDGHEDEVQAYLI